MTAPQDLSDELYWLTLTILMSALFWMPVIFNRIREQNLWPALLNPDPDPQARNLWAVRADKAHKNAVENLVLFAPLVLALEATHASTYGTATACMIYFFTRLAHYAIYVLGIPLIRTVAFAIGFVVQAFLAATILGWA